MLDMFGMAGSRYLILGGGQGMGEATTRLIASLGGNVAVVDLDLDRANRVAADARALGVCAHAFSVDVTDAEALVATIGEIEDTAGPIDGMASIIGMAAWSSLLDMTTDIWDLDHNRNLRYFFVAAQELARRLYQRNAPGSMVAVASVDGIRSAPNHASYGAAKAGLMNLVKSMAVEWADGGIRVNCVAPGGIVTPRVPLTDADAEARSMALLPMRRRGFPDDIAKAVAYFLSDMSPYVTGQTLAVDGGYTAAGFLGRTLRVPGGGTLGMPKEGA
ncbi:SDR family oxidoreductase [Sphingobium sufflavum]|uniref:SDR family NAD(P)-dependent oxidoreductase n=1 Tax=Sphingobium sufflavum TaxID=1129547 RepID=UPI001F230DCE|nr:SDR family oxidoreductase [Sphingobium sufflavum]MCE7796411.1 SDR family oxidoreductase [Sphingobium sufflavum]